MILVFLGSWRSTLIIAVSIPLSILSFAARAQRPRRDHQHHDPRRTRPRRRHPGRRRHRRDREHQPQSRTGQGDRAGHPRRRGADRRPRAGLDHLHLHRLRAHVLPDRRGALSLRPAGRSRRLRHARVLPAVANRRADHGQVPAAGARRRGRRQKEDQPQSPGPLPARASSATSRSSATATTASSSCASITPPSFSSSVLRLCRRLCRGCSIPTSVRTSFPPSTAASSRFTSARTPALASKTWPTSATRSTTPSARPSRKTKSSPSSTTSACPTADSTPPTPTPPPSARLTPTSPVSLTEKHHPTDEYVQKLRDILNHRFPGVTFYTLPVDMVTQILNFGLPAPIDIQIVGHDLYGNRAVAEQLLNTIKHVPGTADLRIQQPFDNPQSHRRCGPHQGQPARTSAARRRPKPACRHQRQLPDLAELLARSDAMASATTSPCSRRNTVSTPCRTSRTFPSVRQQLCRRSRRRRRPTDASRLQHPPHGAASRYRSSAT